MTIRVAFALAALSLFLIGTTGTIWLHDQELKQRLEEAEARIEIMADEHAKTLEAVNMALCEREDVHDEADIVTTNAHKVLEGNPDIANMPLPDDMRMCIRWDESSGDCAAYASAGAAGGHSHTALGTGADSGRSDPAADYRAWRAGASPQTAAGASGAVRGL